MMGTWGTGLGALARVDEAERAHREAPPRTAAVPVVPHRRRSARMARSTERGRPGYATFGRDFGVSFGRAFVQPHRPDDLPAVTRTWLGEEPQPHPVPPASIAPDDAVGLEFDVATGSGGIALVSAPPRSSRVE